MHKFLIAATMALTAVTPYSSAGTVYSTSSWASSMSSVIHSDNTQSAVLPDGRVLWVYGDTTQINGTSTVGAYGYPHSAFVTQQPGTLTFTAVSGSYGYGWQQVPNWSDGSYFWMSTPVVDNGVLYVLGERVSGGASFTVVGTYVAVFDTSTLAFQRIVQVPAGATGTTIWGGVVSDPAAGWYITGTHPVPCAYATNCKAGDIAFVPFGALATPSAWSVHDNVIPATTNIGTTLAMVKAPNRWDIFTKLGDAYGGTRIERLTASSPLAVWALNGTWAAPSPTGTVTYGVAVHPEQASASSRVLVSYNVNGGADSDYHALFLYLPL